MGKKTIKFRGRHWSVGSIISMVIGVCVLICLITLIIISGINNGNQSFASGMAGVIAMVVSAIGFLIAIRSSRERDIFYGACYAGMIENGIAFIAFIIIYLMGLV